MSLVIAYQWMGYVNSKSRGKNVIGVSRPSGFSEANYFSARIIHALLLAHENEFLTIHDWHQDLWRNPPPDVRKSQLILIAHTNCRVLEFATELL